MRDTIHRKGVTQRADQDVLADEVVQGLRPVFPGEHDVRGGGYFSSLIHAEKIATAAEKCILKLLFKQLTDGNCDAGRIEAKPSSGKQLRQKTVVRLPGATNDKRLFRVQDYTSRQNIQPISGATVG